MRKALLTITGAISFSMLAATGFAQSAVDASKSADANFFKGSSSFIMNHAKYSFETEKVNLSTEPHLDLKLGGVANLDVYTTFNIFNGTDAVVPTDGVVPHVDLYKEFSVANGSIKPVLGADLPLTGYNVALKPAVEVYQPIDISTKNGVLTPYFYGWYDTVVRGSKIDGAVLKSDVADSQSRASFNALSSSQKEDIAETINTKYDANKLPLGTYSRLAVAYKPTAIKGLKLTAMTNLIANYNTTYIVDSNSKVISNNQTWDVTTQPALRADYKISDKLALRNTLSVSMDGLFEDFKAEGNPLSLASRLTVTLF